MQPLPKCYRDELRGARTELPKWAGQLNRLARGRANAELPLCSPDSSVHFRQSSLVTRRPLRTSVAFVLGAALVVEAPFVFLALSIIGLQPFQGEESRSRVVVVPLSGLLG